MHAVDITAYLTRYVIYGHKFLYHWPLVYKTLYGSNVLLGNGWLNKLKRQSQCSKTPA
jgi:hypothetical protein